MIEKLGLIFKVKDHNIKWLKSHAMTPTPLLYEDKIRVFYTGRSFKGESLISYVDLDLKDPSKILYVHKEPLFDVGSIGMFDDSGTICTSVIRDGEVVYLYYTAYSMSLKVPYRNSIGVAVSHDGGTSFKRMFDGPIVDRTRHEPYFVISPWVLKNGNDWHLWYSSAVKWIEVDEKPESIYHIKYAHSDDGLNWVRKNETCIFPLHPEEANARPSVILDKNKYKMWFTYRGSRDFRDGLDSYRIGYAEADVQSPSIWARQSKPIQLANEYDTYDNLMQAYPAILILNDKKFLFYNGNGFGYDGFCCAIIH